MSNVVGLSPGLSPPVRDMKEIAQAIRRVADALERGECGEVLHACVLMDNGRDLMTMHVGTRHTTKMEWLGMLQCAIHITQTK